MGTGKLGLASFGVTQSSISWILAAGFGANSKKHFTTASPNSSPICSGWLCVSAALSCRPHAPASQPGEAAWQQQPTAILLIDLLGDGKRLHCHSVATGIRVRCLRAELFFCGICSLSSINAACNQHCTGSYHLNAAVRGGQCETIGRPLQQSLRRHLKQACLQLLLRRWAEPLASSRRMGTSTKPHGCLNY